MHRIMMVVEYDGTNYHGMQLQDNAHTIQAEIEQQIWRLTGEKVSILAAGRTDAGVHALGQVITFDTESTIPPERWAVALNTYLPDDIRALSSQAARLDFHPQYQAISKRYAYWLYRSKAGSIIYRQHALCTTERLRVDLMRQACKYFLGRHDFRAFCARGSHAKTFERTVMDCKILAEGPFLRFEIEADGFLYNMVRIIMGTLLEVGRGRIPVYKLNEIVASCDRRQAGPTVPPHGLYMMEVRYPDRESL
ncbi:MAG: tRNA pseudouridine(38-40) synthase TruA [Syntrophomonadaceae bacterium]